MTTNLKQGFIELLDEMKKNKHVEIISAQYKFPNNAIEGNVQRVFDAFHEIYPHKIPLSLKELVVFPARLSLNWMIKDSNDPELIGEFCLHNIINVLTISDFLEVYNEDIDESTKALMRKARYFDSQFELGRPTGTVLVIEANIDFPDIYFLDDDKIYPMQLTLEQYLEALLLTKGMYYWQYLFCDKTAYLETSFYKKRYVTLMLETLPTYFPGPDYSMLMERFQALDD